MPLTLLSSSGGASRMSRRFPNFLSSSLAGSFHIGSRYGQGQEQLNHFVLSKPLQTTLHKPLTQTLAMPMVVPRFLRRCFGSYFVCWL